MLVVILHQRPALQQQFALPGAPARQNFGDGGDSGPGAVPGKSAESLIIKLVSGLDPDGLPLGLDEHGVGRGEDVGGVDRHLPDLRTARAV